MASMAEISPLAGGKRSSQSTDLDEPKKRHKSDSPVSSQGSFTDRFFMDMAATIARNFPVSDFAKAHSCSAREVLDALSAVVLSPLREPQPWHGAGSVSEYGRVLIDDWRTQNEESADGTPGMPIIISDTCCSSPTQQPARECSLHSRNSVSPLSKTESAPGDHPSPSTLSEGITLSKESPEVKEMKTLAKEKSIWRSREPSAARKEVRLDIYGTCIPVDKWIDGYHIPAPPKIRRDALSDAEFFRMLSEGWFD